MIGIFMIIFAHFLSTKTAETNSDVGPYLKDEQKTGIYMPEVFNLRLILITTMLFSSHFNLIVPFVLMVLIQVGYISFIIIGRSHIRGLDFFRVMWLDCGLLVIFLLRIIEIKGMAGTLAPKNGLFPFFAYLEYIIYILGIVLSYISFVYHILRDMSHSNKVDNSQKKKKMREIDQPRVLH